MTNPFSSGGVFFRPARRCLALACAISFLMTPAARSAPPGSPQMPSRGQPSQDGATITPNYKDADINQIIQAVGEVTGKNFIIDPRVNAKVTMLSSTPMSPEAFYQAFLSVLQVYGYAAVPAGKIIKIIPNTDVRQSPSLDLPENVSSTSDEIVTQIITMKNISAAQLVPLLRPLIPQQGHLAAYPAGNMLIISDRASNVARIMRIIERMDQTKGKIIIDGNAACGMGAVFAGVTVVAWYPITPSTSLIEATTDLLNKFRVTPEGKATFAVVQAEDELAAIGMVLGAGWAGARAMTSTSGPGISLMAEFSGLGYYAEIPGVIFDVQRTGPSTGMPTRTQQSDLLSTAFLSHGDTRHVILLPGSVKECFELAYAAFDLAERLQTPVFVLSDLDLGMNNWMSEPFAYPDKPLDRGKVLTAEDLKKAGSFARYRDVDGDAIGWRTLPGTMHPKAAYFTRGSGHDDAAGYTERPEEYQKVMDRLARKFENARKLVPAPVVTKNGTSKIGFLAYGSTDFALRESLDQIEKEHGVSVDYMRIRAYPFAHEIHDFVASHERVYVVEQDRDGQLASLLKLDLPGEQVAKLRSILRYNGLPADARSITDEFATKEGL